MGLHRVKSWFSVENLLTPVNGFGRAAVVLSFSPDFNLLIYLLRQVRWKSPWNSRRFPRMIQVRDLFSPSFITSFLILSNEWNVRNEALPLIRCASFTFTPSQHCRLQLQRMMDRYFIKVATLHR